MDEVFGLIAFAGYIVAVIGLAAAITFVVIKIFPTERNPKKSEKAEKAEKPAANGGGDPPSGSLFRRSKRER